VRFTCARYSVALQMWQIQKTTQSGMTGSGTTICNSLSSQVAARLETRSSLLCRVHTVWILPLAESLCYADSAVDWDHHAVHIRTRS
jgi:hypothetical protein